MTRENEPIGQMTIREATVEDAAILLRLIAAAFEEYVGVLDPPSGAGRLSVLPRFRNQGIGHALLDDVERRAKDGGAPASASGCVCNFRTFSPDTTAWDTKNARMRGFMKPVVLTVTLLLALAGGALAARQAIPQATGANVARDLRGAIDIHVHCRSRQSPALARRPRGRAVSREKGMRAIVLKSHFDPTAGLALLARKAVPGIEVFGGHRSQPAGRRHERARGRAHGAGQRRMGTRGLDVDVRFREHQVRSGQSRTRLSSASRRTARCCRKRKR